MSDYKVWFDDGNIKIFEAPDILSLVNYLLFTLNYHSKDIIKIKKRIIDK